MDGDVRLDTIFRPIQMIQANSSQTLSHTLMYLSDGRRGAQMESEEAGGAGGGILKYLMRGNTERDRERQSEGRDALEWERKTLEIIIWLDGRDAPSGWSDGEQDKVNSVFSLRPFQTKSAAPDYWWKETEGDVTLANPLETMNVHVRGYPFTSL